MANLGYWSRHGVHSKARKEAPDRAFLLVTGSGDKKEKRYPVMTRQGGDWKYSRRWCNAARNRLAARIEAGHTELIPLFNRISRIMNREFDAKLPATWAAHVKQR